MSPLHPILVVTRDDLRLHAIRSSCRDARLENPVVGCLDAADVHRRALGPEAPYAVPSVVVTDLRLGRRSGLEVLHQFRDEPALRSTPVIMVADWDDVAAVAEAEDLGATVVLSRTVAPTVIAQVIRDLDLPWSIGRAELLA